MQALLERAMQFPCAYDEACDMPDLGFVYMWCTEPALHDGRLIMELLRERGKGFRQESCVLH